MAKNEYIKATYPSGRTQIFKTYREATKTLKIGYPRLRRLALKEAYTPQGVRLEIITMIGVEPSKGRKKYLSISVDQHDYADLEKMLKDKPQNDARRFVQNLIAVRLKEVLAAKPTGN